MIAQKRLPAIRQQQVGPDPDAAYSPPAYDETVFAEGATLSAQPTRPISDSEPLPPYPGLPFETYPSPQPGPSITPSPSTRPSYAAPRPISISLSYPHTPANQARNSSDAPLPTGQSPSVAPPQPRPAWENAAGGLVLVDMGGHARAPVASPRPSITPVLVPMPAALPGGTEENFTSIVSSADSDVIRPIDRDRRRASRSRQLPNPEPRPSRASISEFMHDSAQGGPRRTRRSTAHSVASQQQNSVSDPDNQALPPAPEQPVPMLSFTGGASYVDQCGSVYGFRESVVDN